MNATREKTLYRAIGTLHHTRGTLQHALKSAASKHKISIALYRDSAINGWKAGNGGEVWVFRGASASPCLPKGKMGLLKMLY